MAVIYEMLYEEVEDEEEEDVEDDDESLSSLEKELRIGEEKDDEYIIE